MAEQPDDRSYYALLGVAPTASDEEIRRAFRQLATTLHPDKASMCLCTQAMACCNARRVSLHIRSCRRAPLPSRLPMLHSMTRRRPCSPRYRRLTK